MVPSARIVAHAGKLPKVAPNAFIAPSASVVGDVTVGDGAGIWYNAVIRGDSANVTLGTNSTVQERAVIHATKPTTIGAGVVVGVGAHVSGCTLQDRTLVGVGASVQEGAVVEHGAVVAAGSVVKPGMTIPSGQLWSGNPIVYLRDLTSAESEALAASAEELSIMGSHHALETDKDIETIEAEKEQFKEQLTRGGDTIMNPSPNFFEDRPGAIWRQVGNGDVTYQSVDQKTIDARGMSFYCFFCFFGFFGFLFPVSVSLLAVCESFFSSFSFSVPDFFLFFLFFPPLLPFFSSSFLQCSIE